MASPSTVVHECENDLLTLARLVAQLIAADTCTSSSFTSLSDSSTLWWISRSFTIISDNDPRTRIVSARAIGSLLSRTTLSRLIICDGFCSLCRCDATDVNTREMNTRSWFELLL
jgi:hypothetical protein